MFLYFLVHLKNGLLTSMKYLYKQKWILSFIRKKNCTEAVFGYIFFLILKLISLFWDQILYIVFIYPFKQTKSRYENYLMKIVLTGYKF